jgi:hypothetical protein
MIQVRDAFQVKFGKIDQAVALFARLPRFSHTHAAPALHYHVLTDISGPMYTLVTELMVPNLSGWETIRDKSFQEPDFAAWFKEFQLYVDDGRREYYTLEGDCTDWSKPGVTVVRQIYRALKWQIRPAVTLLQQYGALVTAFGVGRSPRILTDASGPMFQVVVEFETDDLAQWEQQRRSLFAQPDFQAWFAKLLSQVEAGAHEFYRVEA